ncbi:MAG: hypothetical protein U0930_14390 [Pirellulales bacterium]
MLHGNNSLETGAIQARQLQISLRQLMGFTTVVAIVLMMVRNFTPGFAADIGNIVLCVLLLCAPVGIAWAISACCKILRAESAVIRIFIVLGQLTISTCCLGASVCCLSQVRFLSGMFPYHVHFCWIFLS